MAPQVRGNVFSLGGTAHDQTASFVERYCEHTPLKRITTEEDFRGAIVYHASDSFAYVTRHVICVDGIWCSW